MTYVASTSDSTEAIVDNPIIRFTNETWNTWHPIYVIGMWDDEVDGDVPFFVSVEVLESEDPSFRSVFYTDPGAVVHMFNRDDTPGPDDNRHLIIKYADESERDTTEAGGLVKLLVTLETALQLHGPRVVY